MTKSWNDLAELEIATKESFNNLLLIDGNNLAFRWKHRKNYNSYQEEYERTVNSLSKSYEAEKTIVCFDFGKSYYRKEKYPEYKENRKKPTDPEEIKKAEEFFSVLNDIPNIISANVAKFRGVEADDIITYFVKNIADKYDHTWIISSDRDLYQLISDNVSIFNLFSRKEITLETLEEQNLTPSTYMLARIIEGDTGDNIFGVEGIGDKRSKTLAKEYGTLENLINSLPLKGTSKYIKNLNASKDLLLKNESLINLKDYNMEALSASKESSNCLEELEKVCLH